MNDPLTRRSFLKSACAGAIVAGSLVPLPGYLARADTRTQRPPPSKVRVGKVYLGHPNPGWPMSSVDLPAEVRRIEGWFEGIAADLQDVEFVEAGVVRTPDQVAKAKDAFRDVDGILAIHLTLGTGPQIQALLETGHPMAVFFPPFSGHEWHTVASLQRQGKRIEAVPSSDPRDLAVAVRPFRAMRRLRESRVLHISQHPADAAYCEKIRNKFGTEIRSLGLPDLETAYQQADADAAARDAAEWTRDAERIVEPTEGDILKASRMYVALQDLMARHQAEAVTMNCLGMGLVDRGMGYPCLGFARLNNTGRCGVCEADLKSTMTQLLFQHLVAMPGFVTDPVLDLSQNAIVHAHCVAATRMAGPDGVSSPYVMRSHLEDGKGVSLQVRLPVGQPVSMARLIGTDLLLFSTGEAVDSPFDERACRTKLTMKVANVDRFLENWSCGLHRVVFYGDHTRDIRRYCRFMGIKVLREGEDDLRKEPGLEWDPHVHA